MPRTTIAEACRQRGIDRQDWEEAKRQGVDPWDRKAMKEWQDSRRHRIQPGTEITEPEAAGAQTLEQMEDALRKAQSIDDVKILKEKLTALKTAVQVRRETRELISLAEVEERDIRIAAVVKAGILKLCNDSSPMCEGLGAAEIHGVLLRQGTQVLEMMADEQSAFWQEASA